jgi:hypothetical protein
LTASVPEQFPAAYAGLADLVDRAVSGAVRPEELGGEADAWRRTECRGAATLARAAINALRYELASGGLKAGGQEDARRLLALAEVEAALEPPGTASGDRPEAPIAEVALPVALKERMPNGRGFVMGELRILFERTEGPPYAHLSVSHPRRYPTWPELLRARSAPGGPSPNLWAWLPKEGEGSPSGGNTVHLYLAPPRELMG